MGDEHLDTVSATKSDEFIKSCVENLVPNPSESEGESKCDIPASEAFTTFSNVLFDTDYDFYSVDDQSLSDEDLPEKIYSNPLFDEEIIPMKIDQHPFNFAGELTLLKSIPPGIDETDCDHENEIHLDERLLYDNSSPRPPEEFVFENSNADIESFSPSPIPVEISDQKVPIPNLMITRVSNQEKSPDLLPHQGFEAFQPSSKCPMMIHEKNIPILDVPLFYFYPIDQFKYGGNWVKLSDLKQALHGRHPMLISSLIFLFSS
nr:hypothetical protein [Tanacetum cinerariifolium]